MSYEMTALGSLGVLGTVGSGASAGASSGGTGGGASTAAVASGVIDAAGSIIGSIWGAVNEIRAMNEQQRAGASSSQGASSAFLDDVLFGRQAETMARDEARAQQGVQSLMNVQLTQAEAELQRQTARLRQSQVQQEIDARIGGQLGRGRSLPAWAWVGIGLGGVGLALLVVWFVARRG